MKHEHNFEYVENALIQELIEKPDGHFIKGKTRKFTGYLCLCGEIRLTLRAKENRWDGD